MTFKKIFRSVFIICVIAGFAYFIIIKFKASSAGDLAPNFKSKLIDGSNFELNSLKGEYVLLDFWATWCAPCRKEIPELLQFHSNFKNKVTIVSIALEKDATALKNNPDAFLYPWKHQIIEESSFVMLSNIAQLYGVSEIPTKILINPKGEILAANNLKEIAEILN